MGTKTSKHRLRRRRDRQIGVALVVLLAIAGWFLRGELLLRWAEWRGELRGEAGERWLRRVVSAQPSHPRAQYLLASWARRQERYAEMESALQAAEQAGWASELIARQRTLAQAQEGQLVSITAVMNQLLSQPDQPAWEVLEAYSRGYIRSRQLMRASMTIQQWLQLAPDSPEACAARGLAHQVIFDWPNAEAWYRKAVELRPGLPAAELGLGQVLMRKHDYREAYRHLDRATAGHAERRPAQLGMATCLRRLGHLDRARPLLESLLVERDEADVRHELAELDLAADQLGKAEEDVRQGLLLVPRHGGLLTVRARLLQLGGQGDQARQLLAEVQAARARLLSHEIVVHEIATAVDNSPARLQLAEAYRDCGQLREAETWALSATQIDPANREAQTLLKQLREQLGGRSG